jgi:hypothetical protein
MSTFIREMGGLVDEHSLSEVLSDMMSEETAMGRGRNDEEGGGSTGGSIRRSNQQ